MNYIEIEEEMEKTYNGIAIQYEKEAKEDWKDKEIVDKFLEYLSNEAIILDIACGTGELLKYYDEKGFKVMGIDISEEMIKIAKNKVQNAKIINKSLYNINEINKKFDGISATFVFVHIPKEKIKEVISKIYKLLKDNGIFFTVFTTNQKEGLQKEPLNNNYNYYAVNYSNNEINEILKNNKFNILYNRVSKINNLDIGIIIGRKEK